MKYFDKLSAAVQAAFSVRAVDTDKLLYCVKADMDGEGCYYDTYITFDNKTLYLLSGYDRLVKNKKTFDTQFDFKDFSEYPMEEIEKLYVDRYQFTAAAINRQIDRCRPSYKAHYRLPFLEFSSDSLSVKEHSIPLLQICQCGYYINSVPVFLVCRSMLIICTLSLPLRQECQHPFRSVRLWEWNS